MIIDSVRPRLIGNCCWPISQPHKMPKTTRASHETDVAVVRTGRVERPAFADDVAAEFEAAWRARIMSHEAPPGTARITRRRSAVEHLIWALKICVMLIWVVTMALLPPLEHPDTARLVRLTIEMHSLPWMDCSDDWPVRWADGLSRQVDEANHWIDETFGPEITRLTPPAQNDKPPSPAP